MNELWTWATAQPIWLQVFIGLFLFFVALPACLGIGYLLLRAVADGASVVLEVLAPMLFGMLAFAVVATLAYVGADALARLVAPSVSTWFSLPPSAAPQVHLAVVTCTLVAATVLLCYLILRHPRVQTRIAAWRAELG